MYRKINRKNFNIASQPETAHWDYPEFCVTAQMRCKIELNISRRERRWLRPPCLQHNANGGWKSRGTLVHRSLAGGAAPLDLRAGLLIRHPILEVDCQLDMNHAPVLSAAGPLFRDVDHRQIQHFEKAVIGRKHGF